MSDYGVQPTGYVRKPLSVLLSEIEAAMITEFGPGIIQTAQSPFGQINGLMADLASQLDELNLEVYQSYDPDQAEGVRLDSLARLRQLQRNNDTDADFRKRLTNRGRYRTDLADIKNAVTSVDGVTFAAVYGNDGHTWSKDLSPGTIAVVVMGGKDEEIADQIRAYMPPGSTLYGNHYATSSVEGYCRTIPIVRPIVIPVDLAIYTKNTPTAEGCPAPANSTVADGFLADWSEIRTNGYSVNWSNVRHVIECRWSNIEVTRIEATRDGIVASEAFIGFIEISDLINVSIIASSN